MGKTDLDIARTVRLKPIADVARCLGLSGSDIEPYGLHKAKIKLDALERRQDSQDGALVLVTAMTPTPAGEGKTTTTVGLADAFRRLGKRSLVAIREPSLGLFRLERRCGRRRVRAGGAHGGH